MTDYLRLYLDSVLEAQVEADSMMERASELRCRAEKITSSLTGMPRGGGSDRERLLAALADAEEEAIDRLERATARYGEVQQFIDSIPCRPISRAVLRMRYLDCLQWDSIRQRLVDKGLNISLRHVYRLHGEGLRAAREEWNKKH